MLDFLYLSCCERDCSIWFLSVYCYV